MKAVHVKINLPLLIFIFSVKLLTGQPHKVYLFPGQGSDYRIFDSLALAVEFEKVFIHYPVPERNESMAAYGNRLLTQVDTTGSYSFIGVSLGGMLASTIAQYCDPHAVIIISSARSNDEIPWRYRFMRALPVYKAVPAILYKWGSFIAQPVIEPDRKNNKATFKAMLKAKNPKFLKRATHMIVQWQLTAAPQNAVHIHGMEDNTLPIGKTKPDYYVPGGSHMMTLTMGKELSPLVNRLLKMEK